MNVPKSKILQPSKGNKNLSNSISLPRNNIWSKAARPGIKATNNSQENKSNGPIRLFSNLQKSDTSTKTRQSTRLTRANSNMNRPLRPMIAQAQKTQKLIVGGIPKINTISSARRRQTVAPKNIQAQFRPNPVSLQEILSSKTSRDITKKRETLTGSQPVSKPSIGSSRSRMTYSYRVEVTRQYRFKYIFKNIVANWYDIVIQKSRESRASIFSGALRVPRNNVKVNSQIGNTVVC
jgi:hypothetical protein